MNARPPRINPTSVSYRPIDTESLEDCAFLAKWKNDVSIRHLITPQRDAESVKQMDSAESVQAQRRSSTQLTAALDLFILVDGKVVGCCDVIWDPPYRITREGKVAWFGLTIGDAEYRGRGLGKLAVQHLEEYSKKEGATLAEAGVFEFNETSQKLFQTLGYTVAKRIEDFTYWNGKRYADIRYTKSFV